MPLRGQTTTFVTSLATALEYLHEQQVAHRNPYPDEVWAGTHHQLLLSEPLTDLERSFGPREELIDYVLPEPPCLFA